MEAREARALWAYRHEGRRHVPCALLVSPPPAPWTAHRCFAKDQVSDKGTQSMGKNHTRILKRPSICDPWPRLLMHRAITLTTAEAIVALERAASSCSSKTRSCKRFASGLASIWSQTPPGQTSWTSTVGPEPTRKHRYRPSMSLRDSHFCLRRANSIL